MMLDPRAMAELVQRLETQVVEHRPRLEYLTLAVGSGDFKQALQATGMLYAVLESIVATRAVLSEHVAAADGLGEPGESLIELAIRARRIVIRTQISRLRDTFRHQAAATRANGWFVGEFRGIDDVTRYLEGLVQRSCIWERYRRGQPQQVGVTEADRATMYHTTVRIAQRTMRELGAVPQLVHFLASGVAASDWLDVHIGCKQIATMLAGEIIADLDAGSVHWLGAGARKATHATGHQ